MRAHCAQVKTDIFRNNSVVAMQNQILATSCEWLKLSVLLLPIANALCVYEILEGVSMLR